MTYMPVKNVSKTEPLVPSLTAADDPSHFFCGFLGTFALCPCVSVRQVAFYLHV